MSDLLGRRQFSAAALLLAGAPALARFGTSRTTWSADAAAVALADPRLATAGEFASLARPFAPQLIDLEDDVVCQWRATLAAQLSAAGAWYGMSSGSDLQLLQQLARELGRRLRFHAFHAAGLRGGRTLRAASFEGRQWDAAVGAWLRGAPRPFAIHTWLIAP